MTAFNNSQIPVTIDTFEKLVAWGSLVLNTVNPDLETIEGPGAAVKSSQFGIFKIDSTGKTNAFSRQSFELESDFAYYNGPLYERVKEFSTTVAPTDLVA
jgi:hypothetical protein